ncbi:MAG: YbhB/YbcL family Raf kinase inhibitor-like protein [Hydrogenophaga sp.]|nr:YbhB/YbcL family Raf kinase inhibitor-like protein [Hydrogenophaga sp.]
MNRFFQSVAASIAAIAITTHATDFTLTSPSIQTAAPFPTAHVLNGFGCEGGNRSPALMWHNVPADTKSLAVTMYDPDAPTGSGWWHWILYNIPVTVKGLPENAGSADGKHLPLGSSQGRTDFGTHGYGGACPPAGNRPHRYIFTVHALTIDHIAPPVDASAAMIGYLIHSRRTASASLQTTFSR